MCKGCSLCEGPRLAVDIATYQAYWSTYASSLASGDYVAARTALLQAVGIAAGLGPSASAGGATWNLVTADKVGPLLDAVDKLQVAAAMKAGGGRLIRTGLSDGRGRYDHGVRHD